MLSTSAIWHQGAGRYLEFDEKEKPLVLQLGGYNLKEFVYAAKIAEDMGYNEININAGCPSDRVHRGKFGVCLMADIDHMSSLIEGMTQALTVPVTVKCRIGLDGRRFSLPLYDSYEYLCKFIAAVSDAGARRVIIHARIAVLGLLNPKQNRDIPPLRYDVVHAVARQFPHVSIEINGGIKNLADSAEQLQHVDAVMVGRAALEAPLQFLDADTLLETGSIDKDALPHHSAVVLQEEIIRNYIQYLTQHVAHSDLRASDAARRAIRHLLCFFSGLSGAKSWRSSLSKSMERKEEPGYAVEQALALLKRNKKSGE
ncbi:tRNA-dihydrouridine(20/20a) synthase-like [Ylistrum balloti]|uniref:tRNA-dihydrouridine(20/20a) synthase-like n=1 Tax=Ylistrum balloti TaxID=509963 RepID=UPI002905E0E6|nr:tRNA-dihydrouridine(20/20a) synthase-like [Ylistrum balloti]